MKRALRWWAVPGQAFWALGAIGGGTMLALQPDGRSMDMPLSMLNGTPFPDFRVPGLVLLMLGIGSALSAIAYGIRHPQMWRMGAGMGIVQIGWIVVEILFLKGNMQDWTPQATQFTRFLWILMGGLGALNLFIAWQGLRTIDSSGDG